MRNAYWIFSSILIFLYSFGPEILTDRHNIIYISIEDMYPYVYCYGHDFMHTPSLDAFAEESVTFLDVHCQVALCTPSRSSILTGIRPSTSGIVKIDDNWREFLPDAVSLPRHFRENGYYTFKVGKISDPRNGGMDEAWDREDDQWGQHDNEKILHAMDTLLKLEKPFFFAAGYGKVHDPWDPSMHSLAKYKPDQIPGPGPHRVYKKDSLSDIEARMLALRYYADITDVDSLIGEVLQKAKINSAIVDSLTAILYKGWQNAVPEK